MSALELALLDLPVTEDSVLLELAFQQCEEDLSLTPSAENILRILRSE